MNIYYLQNNFLTICKCIQEELYITRLRVGLSAVGIIYGEGIKKLLPDTVFQDKR